MQKMNTSTSYSFNPMVLSIKLLSFPSLQDLNSDSISDCVAGGKSGVVAALDGKTGALLWSYKVALHSDAAAQDVFAPLFLHDLNSDGVSDVLLARGTASFPAANALWDKTRSF